MSLAKSTSRVIIIFPQLHCSMVPLTLSEPRFFIFLHTCVMCELRSNVQLTTTALNTIDAGFILLDFPAVVGRHDRQGRKNQGRTAGINKTPHFFASIVPHNIISNISKVLYLHNNRPIIKSQKWRTTQHKSPSSFLLTYHIHSHHQYISFGHSIGGRA